MLVFLNVPALPREAYIGGVNKLLDDSGRLTNDSTREFLTNYMTAFADWVSRILAGSS